MAPKTVALTSGEKAALKKIKAKENKAKANPELAAKNKESAGKPGASPDTLTVGRQSCFCKT